jgi:hypothetical protein
MPQLKVPMAVLEREVDEKDSEVVRFQFDDQPLDAGFEIMKPFTGYAGPREKCVRLLAYDRPLLVDRVFAVFALVQRITAKGLGDGLGLVHAPTANRTDIDLYQPDDVRILVLEESDDIFEGARVAEEISGAGDRHPGRGPGADRVTDVVYKKTHFLDSVIPAGRW